MTNKNSKRIITASAFALSTFIGLKSDSVVVQILASFGSSYSFNEFTKTLQDS